MNRRLWLAMLCVYALAGAADMAAHLRDGRISGGEAETFGNVLVAFAAGLFWPADLIARGLIAAL